MRIRITPPRSPAGPRIVISLGGSETSLTVSEATDVHRALWDALLVVAKRHGDIDPRIDALFDAPIRPAPTGDHHE